MIYSMRGQTEGLSLKYPENSEKHIFHINVLNMDISLVIKLIIMKIAKHVPEIHWERSMSQNFDIGLSFCLILCRRVDFQKDYNKIQKLPVFSSKIKTRT